ncbi:MAG: endolytic transglycosylase MltG [Deltaproteobacteria bacterium]|nr:endolytic transglycosylase MltG [Deltaproteobacteria bacterium]
MKKRIIFIGICISVAALAALGFSLYMLRPAERQGTDQIIVIRDGMTLGHVADILKQEGFLEYKTPFILWARIRGVSRKIKAGEYQLSHRMSPCKILEIIIKGAVISHSVTIPEGYSSVQIADLLVQKGLVHRLEFLALIRDPAMLERYGIDGLSLEGYIYPDTYQFGRGLSAELILDTMVKRFWQLVLPHEERVNASGMTWNEVVTLASIVEKETGLAEERPLIASVFLNRLDKRMRLESDPTVIYGIENFDGNLTRKDLQERTPYNTYVIRGLPPGPIANPGLDAIMAVLNPAKTDYLYFVSRNDGSHHFSKTLSEHNRAVLKYQKRRKLN